jgi:glycosyltransferase involved in cell wall biosynthesis
MKTVAVMLCTFNGEKFLGDQLRTLAEQTVKDLVVFVSDDGSTDNTLRIIEENKNKYPHLNIQFLESSLRDSRKGFQYNFLSIFNLPAPPAKYIAFCDQDDLWEKDKLETAIKSLQNLPQNQPGLYGGRTRLIDEHDHEIGFSLFFSNKPSFANALVQSMIGGNTIVINAAAWYLMKSVKGPDISSHDWWTYIMVTGVGGFAFYDPEPKVRYRQHQQNLVGPNSTFKARLFRLKKLMQGEFGQLIDMHIQGLLLYKQRLTPENQHILENFIQARQPGLIHRIRYFFASKVYRQSFLDNIALFLAVLWRKI